MKTFLPNGTLPRQIGACAGRGTVAVTATLGAIEHRKLEAALCAVAANANVAQIKGSLLTIDDLAEVVPRRSRATRLAKSF
jgi:hypothetical protein